MTNLEFLLDKMEREIGIYDLHDSDVAMMSVSDAKKLIKIVRLAVDRMNFADLVITLREIEEIAGEK